MLLCQMHTYATGSLTCNDRAACAVWNFHITMSSAWHTTVGSSAAELTGNSSSSSSSSSPLGLHPVGRARRCIRCCLAGCRVAVVSRHTALGPAARHCQRSSICLQATPAQPCSQALLGYMAPHTLQHAAAAAAAATAAPQLLLHPAAAAAPARHGV